MAEPPLPPDPDAPTDLTAQKKFSCPLCGGEAHWDPARQALICVYCGAALPAQVDHATGEVVEHDLVAALRDVPDDQRGWMTATQSVRCQSCQAITVFPAGVVAQRCAFCGSSALLAYEQQRAPIRPESVMVFKISETQVRDAAHQWYKTRSFAPNRLKTAALTDKVHGFYLPYWTFDAQVHCRWSAEAGYFYYVTEEYRDSDGKLQTRQVQRTRWEPVSGEIDHSFDDELVAASRGAPADLLRQIAPFPTVSHLVPYDASYLSGWVVEQYQIDLQAAASQAKAVMDSLVHDLCWQEVPGDTKRSLITHPNYTQQTFKHVLLPVWVLSYNYVGKPYQVLINGYTGTIAGRYPFSWVKLTFCVLILVIIAVIVIVIANHYQYQDDHHQFHNYYR